MLASEFINTIVFGMLLGTDGNVESMKRNYEQKFFFVPRLYCKDGFNISVQVHQGNYCASENGTRTFGLDWKLVEWGFPSEDIDPIKFNAEDKDDTQHSVGAYVEVGLIDGLCEEHGGFDLETTLQKQIETRVG